MIRWGACLVYALVLARTYAVDIEPDEHSPFRVLRSVSDYLGDDPDALLPLALAGRASYDLVHDRLRFRQFRNVTATTAVFADRLQTVICESAKRPALHNLLRDYLRVDGNVVFLVGRFLQAQPAHPMIVLDAIKYFIVKCCCESLPGLLVSLLADTGNVCKPLLEAIAPYYKPIPIQDIPDEIMRILRDNGEADHWMRAYARDAHLFQSLYFSGTVQILRRFRAAIRSQPGLIAALYRCGVRFQLSQFPALAAHEARHMSAYLSYYAAAFRLQFIEAVNRDQYEVLVVLLREPALVEALWKERARHSLFLFAARLLALGTGTTDLVAALDRVPGMQSTIRVYSEMNRADLLHRFQAEHDICVILLPRLSYFV